MTEGELLKFELITDDCIKRATQRPLFFYKFIGLNAPEIEESKAVSTIDFHPNPSPDGIFYYDNIGRERPPYIVYDVSGEQVKKGTLHSKGQINLHTLDTGIYFITILSELGWRTFRVVW